MVRLLTFTLLIFLAACSAKKTSTPAKFSVSVGAITEALTADIANGGAFLIAEESSGLTMGRVLRVDGGTTYNESFPNGTWNFHVITWQGGHNSSADYLTDGNFTGVVRCGSVKGILLEGSPVTVDLTVTNQNCDLPRWHGPVLMPTVTNSDGVTSKAFRGTQIVTCRTIPNSVSNSTDCVNDPALSQYEKGYATSYRFVLEDFDRYPGRQPSFKGNPIVSKCMRVEESSSSGLISGTASPSIGPSENLRLPNSTNFNIGLRLRAFFKGANRAGTRTDCNTDWGFEDIPLYRGTLARDYDVLGAKLLDHVYLDGAPAGSPTGDALRLFVRVNEDLVCRAPRLSTSFVASGFGTPHHPWGLCNLAQIEKISEHFGDGIVSGADYVLLKNVNLWHGLTMQQLNLGFMIPPFKMIGDPIADSATEATSTAFTGHFNGNGRTVVGLNYEAPSPWTLRGDVGFVRHLGGAGKISNLTLVGVMAKAELAKNVGAVVGRSYGKLEKLTVLNADIEGKEAIGGVVGYFNAVSSDQGMNGIIVRDLNLRGWKYAGGIVGSFYPGPGTGSSIKSSGVYKANISLTGRPPACTESSLTNSTDCMSGIDTAHYWEGECRRQPDTGSTCPWAGWVLGGGSTYCYNSSITTAEDCQRKWKNDQCEVPGVTSESDCNTGNLAWEAPQWAGGLAGYIGTANEGPCTNTHDRIIRSRADVTIRGDSILGGLVGDLRDNCGIVDSYAFAKVHSLNPGSNDPGYNSRAGGLIGRAVNSTSSLKRLLQAKSAVIGYAEAGDLIGRYTAAPTCVDVIYSSDANAGADLTCDLHFTHAGVRSNASFDSNWDSAWVFADDTKDTPKLSWETEDRKCHNNFDSVPDGSGTEADPWVICTVGHLAWLNNRSGAAILGDDLDYRGVQPGFASSPVGTFKASLDGRGHTIMNLDAVPTSNGYALINLIDTSGVIINTNLFNMTVANTSQEQMAGLAITNQGLISGVNATVKIEGSSQLGGLVRTNAGPGIIQDSSVDGLISTASSSNGSHFGGVAAINYSVIQRVRSYVKITLNSNGFTLTRVGGIAGYQKVVANTTRISEADFAGNLVTTATGVTTQKIGGIVGESEATVENCSADFIFMESSIDGGTPRTQDFGGIVGMNTTGGSITKCISKLHFKNIGGATSVSGKKFYTITSPGGGSVAADAFYMDTLASTKYPGAFGWMVNGTVVYEGPGPNAANKFAGDPATFSTFNLTTDHDDAYIWSLKVNDPWGPNLMRTRKIEADRIKQTIVNWSTFK